MSIGRQVYVRCDGDDCSDALGEWGARTVAEARSTARALGWTRTTAGMDLCKHCTTEARTGVVEATDGTT